ncbi:MAG: recombinase family protein [Defluviitaleaceae bacterium]|nr:recombinase family protein [Defluviitaleaceae bacterium]
MNAVIYARYSSRNQSELSIEGQLKVCYAFAQREGYNVIKEYIDRAKSGTEAENRPQFQKMITASTRGQFQIVLVYQLDRFSRNQYDNATYKMRLKKSGVRVVSARENLSDDASGKLMETLLEGMAEYYSNELSQKIRRGQAISIEKRRHISGIVPLGYKLTEDKQYEIDPITAPIVQKMYELYAAGYSLKEVGIAIKDKFDIKFGNIYNYVGKILDNVNYVGTYTRGATHIPNAIPRIVSDELFEKVKIMRNKKKKAPATARANEEYILTTTLFCGHCRDMMIGTGGTSRSGRVYHYYGCRNTIHRKTCDKKKISKEHIENFIISKALEQLTDENIELITKSVIEMSHRENKTHVITDLKRKLREITKAIDNLLNALENGKHIDLLSDKITKREKEKAHLEKLLAIEQMEHTVIDEKEVKFFLHQLKNGNIQDIEYRRALIAVFISAIYLYDDGRVRIIFNASDRPVEVDYELLDEIENLEKGESKGGSGGGRCSYMANPSP